MKLLRCAVYTRKSTEDGLEQEFNSLDAQREACEAYVLSQRHEGWSLMPDRYDDGGYSGGNMERPGLKALLAAVDAGQIDVIVVYKVDRLTRSLADFAKIVERLDAKTASFVSVTQAFNTTTSMGRLTLNVLLSFAQFEREVTGERIRDKVAASKKKGIWMGGPVPLGYQVKERKLLASPPEADRVRQIMEIYLEARSVDTALDYMREIGIVTKSKVLSSGVVRGGIPFTRGGLFHMLGNPIYIGKMTHKGAIYEGEHDGIITMDLWDAVQAKLKGHAPARRRLTNQTQEAMLRGLLTDPEGRTMVPTYATKRSKRYAYYETRKDLARPYHAAATRLVRTSLEKHIIEALKTWLSDEHALRRMIDQPDGQTLKRLFARAGGIWLQLDDAVDAVSAIQSLIKSIAVTADGLCLSIDQAQLGIENTELFQLTIPRPPRTPYREAKVRIDGEVQAKPANSELMGLLVQAEQARKLVLATPELSLRSIASRDGRCRRRLAQLLRLSWLSPRLVEAITNGTQPASMTPRSLMTRVMPIAWSEQESLYNFVG